MATNTQLYVDLDAAYNIFRVEHEEMTVIRGFCFTTLILQILVSFYTGANGEIALSQSVCNYLR